MIVQNILLASESYPRSRWEYRDITSSFCRLYYALDGEAYYEEKGKTVRLKKNHLYFIPAKKRISLYENPKNKFLHTYVHAVTVPAVSRFTEIEVCPETPLADVVGLLRKYVKTKDKKLILNTVQFIFSCVEENIGGEASVAAQIRDHIDGLRDYRFDMDKLSVEMGYCREYLTRSFRLVYHVTPVRYFNQRKMNAALSYLENGVRIKEIAGELNYSSSYSFSKAFKKHFGMSPQKYVQTLKET